MVEVKNLTKRYGVNSAIDNISFTVEEGSIVGFLGPNGAGKSTTMNIITGYLSATSGEVSVGGKDTLDEPNETKRMIGYLPETPPLYLDMTVAEYLDFMYELKKVSLPKKQHIAELCELTRIDDVYGRLIGNLSKGYRQRVGIAQALLGNPPVLILDEPTVGLDPKQIIEIRNLIKDLGRNHTVILSSHILSEVQAVCERIIVINQGKLVADGATDTLARDHSKEHKLIVRLAGEEEKLLAGIKELEGAIDVFSLGERESGVYEISIESRQDTDLRRDLFEMCARNNWPIMALKTSDLTLEELFLQLTAVDDTADDDTADDTDVLEEMPEQANKFAEMIEDGENRQNNDIPKEMNSNEQADIVAESREEGVNKPDSNLPKELNLKEGGER